MPAIADPSDILANVQVAADAAFASGVFEDSIREVFQDFDDPEGIGFMYDEFEKRTVIAIVRFGPLPPLPSPATGEDKVAHFQIVYAVRAEFQGQGRGKRAVAAAVLRLKNELFRRGYKFLCLMAIVGNDNAPSQKLAAATIWPNPSDCIEGVSGLPAKRYLGVFALEPPAAETT